MSCAMYERVVTGRETSYKLYFFSAGSRLNVYRSYHRSAGLEKTQFPSSLGDAAHFFQYLVPFESKKKDLMELLYIIGEYV
jgi:hypothetical protein